jgi:uncharacterized RDD family membrane protein YckC
LPWAGVAANFILGEFFFQKTLGKFLTGSIVVNEWGENPDFKTVLLRTVIRVLPWEPFSFFSDDRGWHDRWTNTFVINRNELEELRRLLRENTETVEVVSL